MALNTNCRFAFDPHSNVLYDPSTMDRVDVSNLSPGERVVGADLADLEAAHEQILAQKTQRRRVLVDVCATLTVLVILAAGIAAGLVNRQRIGDYDGGDLNPTNIATAGGLVPPQPPPNLDILCDVSSVETTAGYKACEAACQPSECCRALDPNNCATESIENEEICAQYDSCISLSAYNGKEMEDDDGYLDTDTTSSGTSGYTSPKGDTVIPEAPVNLSYYCDPRNKQHEASMCGYICQMASCCQSTGGDNCRSDNPERCEGYALCWETNHDYAADTVETPGVIDQHVAELCDRRNMDNEYRRDACREVCSVRSCCFADEESGSGVDNCYRENPDWCGEFSPCLNLHHGTAAAAESSSTTHGEASQQPRPPGENGHVESVCSPTSLRTASGRAECQDLCGDRECCFADPRHSGEGGEGDYNCYDEFTSWCDEYRSCQNLVVASLDEGASGGGQQDAREPPQSSLSSPSSTPPNPFNVVANQENGADETGEEGGEGKEEVSSVYTISELIESTCIEEELKTNLEARDDCMDICVSGACCFLDEDATANSGNRGSCLVDCSDYAGCEILFDIMSTGMDEEKEPYLEGGAAGDDAGPGDEGEESVGFGGGGGDAAPTSSSSSSIITTTTTTNTTSSSITEATTSSGGDNPFHTVPSSSSPSSSNSSTYTEATSGQQPDNDGGSSSSTQAQKDTSSPSQEDDEEHSNEEGGVNVACSPPSLESSRGIKACRSLCQARACCFVAGDGISYASFGGACYGALESWCDEYSTCLALAGATGVNFGAAGGGASTPPSSIETAAAAANSTEDESEGSAGEASQQEGTNSSSAQPSEDYSEADTACSAANLASPNGVEECRSLCQARACCFVEDGDEDEDDEDGTYVSFGGSCYGALRSWCGEYKACLWGGRPGVASSPKADEGQVATGATATASGSGDGSSGKTVSSPAGTSGTGSTGSVFTATAAVTETNETSTAAESTVTVAGTAERPSVASSLNAEGGQVATSATTSPGGGASAGNTELNEVPAEAAESATAVAETAEVTAEANPVPTPTGGKSEADEACSPSKLGDARGREECRAVCDERACCFYGGKSRSPLDCVDELGEWCGEYSACWDLIARGEDQGEGEGVGGGGGAAEGEGGAAIAVVGEEEGQEDGTAGGATSSATSSVTTVAPQNAASTEPEYGSNTSAAVSATGGGNGGGGPPADTSTRPTFGVQEVDTSSLHTGETAMSPVDVACTRERVGTAPGYRECRDVCDERACCFVKGGGHCRFGTNVALCNEYNACWLLYDDGDLNGGR